MKTKFTKSILMIILIMPFIIMNAQITKQQAIDSVMANVIKQDSVNSMDRKGLINLSILSPSGQALAEL